VWRSKCGTGLRAGPPGRQFQRGCKITTSIATPRRAIFIERLINCSPSLKGGISYHPVKGLIGVLSLKKICGLTEPIIEHRTVANGGILSAIGGKADILVTRRDVCF
jgi:hypothetical protein